ncbi:MAG: FAD-dependent oxidoreductase [Pseudomonadota bacterium]
MRSVQTLIVGLGLAGATLALQLLRAKQRICVISDGQAGASSVAAGLITPITGKKLKVQTDYNQLLRSAVMHYRGAEELLGTPLLHRQRVYRALTTSREQSAWSERPSLGLPFAYPAAIDDTPLRATAQVLDLAPAYRLDVKAYLAGTEALLDAEGLLVRGMLDSRNVTVSADQVEVAQWRIRAEQIVFCGGITDRDNAWFSDLSWRPAKGDILTLQLDRSLPSRWHINGHWLTPLDNGLHAYGATYRWSVFDNTPEDDARAALEAAFERDFRPPATLIGHAAGVRPIVAGRRPVIAAAPASKRVILFNGLGSKGTLYAPALAGHCYRYLDNRTAALPSQFALEGR